KVRLIGMAKTDLANKYVQTMDIRFVPDAHSMKVSTHVLKDLIVIQGSMQGNIIINHECFTNVTLMFQEEMVCEGVCPGDVVKMTPTILERIIPPQKVSNMTTESCLLIFKVIVSTQITVIREKLGTVAVQIIGDINEDRCRLPTQLEAVVSNNHSHCNCVEE